MMQHSESSSNSGGYHSNRQYLNTAAFNIKKLNNIPIEYFRPIGES